MIKDIMVRLLMMGMPGVGKGTFASFLTKDFNIPSIILGDEIRNVLKSKTELPFYQDLQSQVNSGHLISAGFAWVVLQNKLKQIDTSNGFLIDGFPRNQVEAEMLEISKFEFDLIVNLKQHEDVILAKLKGRRVCQSCHANYNIADITHEGYLLPARLPKLKGKCDHCGDKLVKRTDDKLSIIKRRMFEFKVKTEPLEKFYDEREKILSFTAYRGVADYPKLLTEIKQRLELD